VPDFSCGDLRISGCERDAIDGGSLSGAARVAALHQLQRAGGGVHARRRRRQVGAGVLPHGGDGAGGAGARQGGRQLAVVRHRELAASAPPQRPPHQVHGAPAQ